MLHYLQQTTLLSMEVPEYLKNLCKRTYKFHFIFYFPGYIQCFGDSLILHFGLGSLLCGFDSLGAIFGTTILGKNCVLKK